MPAAFFEHVLGPHLKYSSCYWPAGVDTLGDAEAAMLALTAERAGLADGQDVLDLGCGWGSLSLWAARAVPAQPVHRGLELAPAARVHRGARPRRAGSRT